LNVTIFEYVFHKFREIYYIENANKFNHAIQSLYSVPSKLIINTDCER